MLLRVVAAAGASAVLGATACGGKAMGPGSDQFHGSIAYPDAGEDAAAEAAPCAEGCGIAPGGLYDSGDEYQDAGRGGDAWPPEGVIDGGIVGYPEGGDEVVTCNGVCVMPEAGEDAGTD